MNAHPGNGFHPSPIRDVSRKLVGSCWSLETGDGGALLPVLYLLGNGILGGHANAAQRRWTLRAGSLVFLDGDGIVTTIFDAVEEYHGEIIAWRGALRDGSISKLVLRKTALPCLSPDDPALSHTSLFKEAIARPQRDFLTVVCANSSSQHYAWLRNIEDSDRNWDLCVTRYDETSQTQPPYEYLAHQERWPKFAALYNLFYPGSPLWAYKFVWFPDDDLMSSWRDVNRLFEICDRNGLHLAQPSLVANGFVNHHITQHDPRYAMRFTRFVEIMCPVFSIEALTVCLPTFRGTKSAYGLDHIWPRLLGNIDTRTAIIDSVCVAHTRAMGTNYNLQSAIAEGLRMQELYAVPANYAATGCIVRAEPNLV